MQQERTLAGVLDRLRAKREAVLPTRIQRAPRQAPWFPLSDGQERLWFIAQLQPGNAAYNVSATVQLAGRLVPRALQCALAEVVRRHEVLRTTYGVVDGRPVQVVAPPARNPWLIPLIDLRGSRGAAAAGREAERLGREHAEAPFDLARGPLLRVSLLRLAAGEHLLLLAMHHIASDGWSMRVLLRETRILYQALLDRRPPPLPELPVQYVDYVAWQRGWLASESARRQLDWWRQQLGERQPVLQLPADRPRTAAPALRGGARRLSLALDLLARLRELCRVAGVTPFVVLLAAFQALLHRLSDQAEILVGVPVANRKRPEIQDLVGFFVNTLVLRAEVLPGATFASLLRGTHEAALGAFDRQELPFGKLVKELQPARQYTHNPLFQAAFVYQNLEAPSWELPGLKLAPRQVARGTAMFDLTLDLSEGPAGVSGELEYSAELFDGATVERWAAHFAVLLAAAVADPERPLASLPLMPAAERQLLLSANDTVAAYPRGGLCVHQLVAEQAARTPDAIAVSAAAGSLDSCLSYRELATRAGRLARHLRGLGVGPEVRVGACLERSLEMIVGLLAILEAGGAYVPLDPSYPQERLAGMAADAAVRVVVAPRALAPALPEAFRATATMVWLDGGETPAGSGEARGEADAALGAAGPENLAYVIYTSGSTGMPKGVMNRHRGVVNRLLWGQEHDALAADDRVLQKTPFSFDVSVWELFWPLMAGSRLVMARPGGHQDGAYLVRTIQEEAITTVHFVPSMLSLFLETPGAARCTSLRRVMASGEALPKALAQRCASTLAAPLQNLYGPTEAAVEVTWWRCDPASPLASVPIGRPVANARIHLLDRHGEQAPVGVPGELHIGGVQVARGYQGRPGLTAERFVPDPFAGGSGEIEANGARLYRTGDLARALPDGTVEYLGRLDHQVKVRGVRIELGEIEAVLGRHPAVAAVVAAVVEHESAAGAGDRQLVAYVVPEAGVETAPPAPGAGPAPAAAVLASGREQLLAELRQLGRASLPESMMPGAFVLLAALPYTPSGKVDRRALPSPERAAQAGRGPALPRNPVEEVLAALWTDLLGVAAVGIQDDFFDLGGHSLLANQLVVRIRDAFHVELPVRSVFAAPTIESLARLVEATARGPDGKTEQTEQTEQTERTAPPEPPEPPLVSRSRDGGAPGVPPSFAQQRLWFLSQLDRESTAYHIPIALRLAGELDAAALAAALAAVMRRHEALRTSFALRQEGLVQVVSPPGEPAGLGLPLVDLSCCHAANGASGASGAGGASGGAGGMGGTAEVSRLLLAEVNRRFDLARGPLLRQALVRLAPREHVLLLVVHHIVCDAWSMAILSREVMTLYRAAVARRPAPLPELPVQYGDFALWQRERVAGARLARELAYWRQQLAGAPGLLDLPADRPRPPLQSFRGGRRRVSLPLAAAQGLAALARREGATLFMALLACFHALLERYTRQQDIVVGCPIAGRHRVETEGLIGLFLNTLALRVDASGLAAWRDLLRQVREVTLAAYAHQELPFEKLVAELDLERNLAYAPLFQTLLVFQNAPAAPLEVPGLDVRLLDLSTGTAKFDLVFNLEATAEGIAGWCLYSADLFDAATAARMVVHFAALLDGILANPGERISELPLLTPAERHQLAVSWNDSGAAPPSGRSFIELFEAAAARRPAAAAVACGEQELSYGELNARASRMARALEAAGVGPEVPVAVLAERGIELLAAMLAIWKAGGAWLPLDPHHPAMRLRQALAQSGSPLLLVSRAQLPHAAAAAPAACRVMALAELLERRPEPMPPPAAPLRGAPRRGPRALPGHLAYVIFTSGSTGAAKGVMIEQRCMLNHLGAKIAALGLTAADRVAQTAPQTFDVSIWQFLAVLLAGGSVDVYPDELVRDPLRLLGEIERRGVTVLETVPSLLGAMLQPGADRRPDLAALRWLVATGEALPAELCRQWFAAYPGVPLVNAYGPTECADDVTHQFLRGPLTAAAAQVPIGRPVDDTRIYVLGPDLSPVPIGVPGELAVGGAQVGRGYLDQPWLTAESFVPDPFAGRHGEPGRRLYRTGDLARWRAAGEVEFLGRIDHQVKLRGFRIELGEIESALAGHPSIRDAVVLARDGREGGQGAADRRLVAWFVAREGAGDVAIPELRAFLLERLPEYMVPAAFVPLARLPLTANGKLDRRALPAPEAPEIGGAAAVREPAAPRTELERSLAGLWAETLHLAPEQVGVDDPFFEIGGNSILGAVLIYRLQKLLGEIVHVVALFDHPTVAGMAAYLARDYGPAVSRVWGLAAEDPGRGRPIDAAQVALLRAIVPALAPAAPAAVRNPRAVFVLSAPRSGSTLLRIMLGGHPRLFAPPELELLSFADLAERRAAFSGRNAFWLEGLIRAVMEIHRCRPEEASALVERGEAERTPTRVFYRRLQDWLGERVLVDKTASYALSQDVLRRAETDFEGACYLHLVRHPRAAIRSFEEARLDQVFFRFPHRFTRRELAELIWVASHQNIVQFLRGVPRERQHWLRFEELVRDPAAEMARICEFLGIPFHADMAQPYEHLGARMADGIHPESRMLGDVKFHQHGRVEASVAEQWRDDPAGTPLGEPTRELAAALGYEIPRAEPAPRPRPADPALVPLQAGDGRPPLFLVHPIGGGVFWYLAMARALGQAQPVYGLRSVLLPPGEAGLPAMAARYLAAVHEVQETGPYFLGGWSMGAAVAFEMACQLRARGEEVGRLLMLDPPPALIMPAAEESDLALLGMLARDLEGLSGRGLGLDGEDLAALAPDARYERVLGLAQAAGALPAEVELDHFRELFAIFRQNRNALRTHVPRSYPGPVVVFRARDHSAVQRLAGAAAVCWGWERLARGGADARWAEGDHYSMLRLPAVESLAEQVAGCLHGVAFQED